MLHGYFCADDLSRFGGVENGLGGIGGRSWRLIVPSALADHVTSDTVDVPLDEDGE
jgi:hypothetical protein